MKNNKKGFTLVELLVVIAIIGILSTVAVVNLNSARTKAKMATAKAYGSSLSAGIILCSDEGSAVNLTAYVAGNDICSTASTVLWATLPDPYDVIVFVDGDTSGDLNDGAWEIEIEDTAASGAINGISCTENGCTECATSNCTP